MPLSFVIDHALPELVEPGFDRTVTCRFAAREGEPFDTIAAKSLWADEITATLMLRPLQLRSDWLNSTQQLTSVIRLDDMVVANADLTARSVYEAPVGNNANPYIWHIPVGPGIAFPSAAPAPQKPGAKKRRTRAPLPGAPMPDLLGLSEPGNIAGIEALTRIPSTIYQVPTTMPPAATPPTPTVIGTQTDGKYIFRTNNRIPANAGLFLRWFHPRPDIGWPTVISFEIGQFALLVRDEVVEVYRDTSPHGDRTAWKRVQTVPLFSTGSYSAVSGFDRWIRNMPSGNSNTDRSLLFLPFRRNQIMLYSSEQQWSVLRVNARPVRLADNSNWNITREDTLRVWVMTPAPGRFQVQYLAYQTGDVVFNSPTTTIDYTPGVAPSIILNEDSDKGSTLTQVRSQPPSYSLPVNDADDCPPDTTVAGDDQSRTYGVELTFNASPDGRWTPFFYNYRVSAARTFGTRPTTPFTVGDVSSATYWIEDAKITAGMNPGDGRLTLKVIDKEPYALSSYYYRSYFPVQLLSGADAVFTGWSEPTEVEPLKRDDLPRTITFSALDRWKQLADTWLTGQRDWSEVGHISVVKTIMEQAGVDVTSMVTPPLTTAYNTPLGLGDPTLAQSTEDVKAPWQPSDEDTAATFIKRICEIFSAWDVGFYLDGVPFYLPRDWFTTPTVTFYAKRQDAIDDLGAGPGATAPLFRNPLVWRTIEPEANVIQVVGGDAETGVVRKSGLWIDFASIRNQNVVNYLGKWRAEIVPVPGGLTCIQLNHAGRKIWEQTRRRRREVEFDADFVPSLRQGHVIHLGKGASPGFASYGNYRIKKIQTSFVKDHWRPASYTAEFIERGYGLP